MSSDLHKTKYTRAWQTVRWWIALTLDGFYNYPVGSGVTVYLPLSTQAGHLNLVCSKIGHTQKHYKEIET